MLLLMVNYSHYYIHYHNEIQNSLSPLLSSPLLSSPLLSSSKSLKYFSNISLLVSTI